MTLPTVTHHVVFVRVAGRSRLTTEADVVIYPTTGGEVIDEIAARYKYAILWDDTAAFDGAPIAEGDFVHEWDAGRPSTDIALQNVVRYVPPLIGVDPLNMAYLFPVVS